MRKSSKKKSECFSQKPSDFFLGNFQIFFSNIQKFCDFLFDRYVGKNQGEFASRLYMSSEELKEMISSNMYIGSHSYHHVWLNTLSKKFQLQEIEKSLDFLL